MYRFTLPALAGLVAGCTIIPGMHVGVSDPYIGSFKVTGMTIAELRTYVEQHLARVISKPQVDARVVAFRSQRVQVTGSVRQPGTVALDGARL